MKVVAHNNRQDELLNVILIEAQFFTEVVETICDITRKNFSDYPGNRKIFESILRWGFRRLVDILSKLEEEVLSCIVRQSVFSQRFQKVGLHWIDAKLVFLGINHCLAKIDPIFFNVVFQFWIFQEPHPLCLYSTKAHYFLVDFLPFLLFFSRLGRADQGDIEVDHFAFLESVEFDVFIDMISEHRSVDGVSVDGNLIGVDCRLIEFATWGGTYIYRRVGRPRRMTPMVRR
jgi:hypothetical protein